MTTQDPNPPPRIRPRDIIALTAFLLIRIPWTIFRTTLYHLTGTTSRPPLLKDLVRSLTRESFENLPLAIHNTLPNRSGSTTLLSPRYRPLKSHLFHGVQRPSFTGYWVSRGLLATPPINPKHADLVIYHLRGSGYALGHPGDTLPGLLFLAEVLEKKGIHVCVFTLDYTLVSNGTFPRQINECLAAYEYLIEEEGVRAEKVCLVGESAGGHLALSFLVALAEGFSLDENKRENIAEGYQQPGSLILLSPWLDLSLSSPMIPILEKRDFISRAFLQRVGGELLRADARLISLFGNFTARSMERDSWGRVLPTRTWVSAGADEIFVDDIVKFVDCAREDGVEVGLRVESGKCHSWQSGEAFLSARRLLDMSLQCGGEELMPGLVGVGVVIAGFV
ncbi:hypothetical protein ABOM_002210 [Aspergillus bombycis]|uniref:Alpha/beta hydrolase fold-3 domain-containing protein n=1 Tax=Aspergillus bombycis TaxID=109264 RepID=A0A1F8A971_9EURO|nr:hypothetical protein ABOM_002210 [Aspergillus bombycis]OGM48231.1 hypothetical protein ABOM_002210 [Aspergillus bombycis]